MFAIWGHPPERRVAITGRDARLVRLRSRGILPDAREVLQLPLAKRISLSYPPPVHKSGSGALMAPPPDLQTGGLLGVYQGLILETFRRTCLRRPGWQRTGAQGRHEGDNCRFNALKRQLAFKETAKNPHPVPASLFRRRDLRPSCVSSSWLMRFYPLANPDGSRRAGHA